MKQKPLKQLVCAILLPGLLPPSVALAQAALRAAVPPPTIAKISPSAPIGPVAAKPALARTFHDPAYRASFDYPANWTFTRRDGEISTFHLDARSAPRNASLRAVVAIPENPFPESTFSGAYVYFSATPHSSAGSCARQPGPASAAAPAAAKKSSAEAEARERPPVIQIAGIPFAHGHDEQRDICVTQRDEIYTTYRRGACYRFDLAINNFCGGEVSGVKDVTQKQLDDVRARLEAILHSFRFDPK